MHENPVVETMGAGSSIPATTPPPSLKKKQATRWNPGTDLGRYKLASGCIVPTTRQQEPGGTIRRGEQKGKPATKMGEFKVPAGFVKSVLMVLAMYDNGIREVFPSNKWLSAYSGVKKRSLANVLKALTQAGFLKKTSRGFRKSKLYWLNWGLMAARQIKWGEPQPEDEGVEEMAKQPGQSKQHGKRKQPHKPINPRTQVPDEPDPVADPLVGVLLAGLTQYGIEAEAIRPVVRQLLKKHAARVALAVKSLDRYPGAIVLFGNLANLPATTFQCPADDDGRARLALQIDLAMREMAPAGWKGDDTREKQVLNALFPIMSRDRQATEAVFALIKHQPGY